LLGGKEREGKLGQEGEGEKTTDNRINSLLAGGFTEKSGGYMGWEWWEGDGERKEDKVSTGQGQERAPG